METFPCYHFLQLLLWINYSAWMNSIEFLGMKLRQVFIDDMVNLIVVLVHYKTTPKAKILVNQKISITPKKNSVLQ